MDRHSDVPGIEEKIIVRIRHHGAGAGDIDHPIDDNQRNMNTLWPDLFRHRLGQRPLRRFGRGKGGEIGAMFHRSRCPDNDDIAFGSCTHVGQNGLARRQQPKSIDPPGPLKIRQIDLIDVAEQPRARIVHKHLDRAHIRFDFGKYFPGLIRIGCIISIGARIAQIVGKTVQIVFMSRQQGDPVAFLGELARNRSAVPRRRVVVPTRRTTQSANQNSGEDK